MNICEHMKKEVLCKQKLDAVLVTDSYNFHYLSGFDGEGLLLISADSAYLLTDSRYTIAAKEFSGPKGFCVIEYSSANPKREILTKLTQEGGIERIGYEDLSMTVSEFWRMEDMLPGAEFLPLGEDLNALRMIKTDEEIALLARAEEIGDEAFKNVLPMIRPGVSELEVAAELEYAMKKAGAQGLSFETIVASGLNSAKPHHKPCEKLIETGDFVTMDFGCIYHGYCSDMTRTVVVGKASEEQKKIYDIVLEAQQSAFAALRPGVTGKEVDAVARDIIAGYGYAENFGHGLGHSVGLFIHEEPRLSPSEDRILVPGNIETVEPGIYIEGFGGVRIEDMCVVTKDGARSLAHSPKELIEL